MTTLEIATAFTEKLKANDHLGAAAEFNSPDIVSIEAMEGPMSVVKGTEALLKKSEWFYDNHEIHGGTVEGPYVNGDQFAVQFNMDVTPRGGQRIEMHEIGLYTVREGKIVEERFFYV